MPITEFNTVKVVQDQLRPLNDLWALASQFADNFGTWMDEKFERLESEQMERWVNEATRILAKLNKTVIREYTKPMQMHTFLVRALEKFRVTDKPYRLFSPSCQ